MESHIKYSKGVCWIGDCRIPFVDEPDPSAKRYQSYRNVDNLYGGYGDTHNEYKEQQGRFTPNLLVCDDMLNDGIKPNKGHRSKSKITGYGEFGGGKSEYHGIGEYMEVDSKSRYYDLDMWFNKMIEKL